MLEWGIKERVQEFTGKQGLTAIEKKGTQMWFHSSLLLEMVILKKKGQVRRASVDEDSAFSLEMLC